MDIDLSFLSEEEKNAIVKVLQRDEELKAVEKLKKKQLKAEIFELKQRSALKVSQQQKNRQCQRCQTELGVLFNKGENCLKCKHLICLNCRVTLNNGSSFEWLCSLCYKQRLLPALTGDWFYKQLGEKYRNEVSAVFGSDIVKSSLRRTSLGRSGDMGRILERNNPFTTDDDQSEAVTLREQNGFHVDPVQKVQNEEGEKVSKTRVTVQRVMSRRYSSSDTDNSDSDNDRKGLQRSKEGVETNGQRLGDVTSSNSSRSLSTPVCIIETVGKVEPSEGCAGRGRSDITASSTDTSSRDGSRVSSPVSIIEPIKPDVDENETVVAQSSECKSIDGNLLSSLNVGFGSDLSVNNISSNFAAIVRPPKPPRQHLEHAESKANAELVADVDGHSNLKKKLSLTEEIERKSPMIGRRELDISKDFLKDFSDSSSSDEEEAMPERASVPNKAFEQMMSHEYHKLDVIKEDFEDTHHSPKHMSRQEVIDSKILKLDINAKNSLSAIENETPISPNKYSSNWDNVEYAISHNMNLDRQTSWISEPDIGLSNGETAFEGDVTTFKAGDDKSQNKSGYVPALSVTDENETHIYLSDGKKDDLVCHSDDELDSFKEDNIDDYFEEGRKKANNNYLGKYLSQSRESLTSIYSEAGVDFKKHTITGEIEIILDYSKASSTLSITILQCRDLAPVHKKKKVSDPYVKSYLLPDTTKATKRKTKVKKLTCDPQYNEIFKYSIKHSDLLTRTLQLSVWSFHRLGQSDFLGEINIPLSEYSFEDSKNTPQWYPLCEKQTLVSEPADTCGELKISLKYSPASTVNDKSGTKANSSGELVVKIDSGHNLPAKRAGSSDPFVKCNLHPEKIYKHKHKTAVIKRTVNPTWNETFTFSKVQMDELSELCLELTVWDHDRFSSHDFLGGVRLGLGKGVSYGKAATWMDSSDKEISFWEEIINHPGEWQNATIKLRSSMVSRLL